MGGTFPNSTICDVPSVFGFHNMDMAKNNPNNAKWASFNYSKQGYEVPSEIVGVVGGSGPGGATDITPKNGFDFPDLGVYFTRKYTVASTRTATRAIPTATGKPKATSSKKSNGAIIGGAVGGGVVALIVVTLLTCWCLRRKRNTAQHSPVAQKNPDDGTALRPPMHGQHPSWQSSVTQAPIYQLSAEAAPVELAAGRMSVKPGFAPPSTYEKYSDVSASPPAQSPPPHGNAYFYNTSPPSVSQTPAPMYGAQHQTDYSQSHSTSPRQQQTYYPPPGQPQVYQQPSPNQPHSYPTPTSAVSSQPSPGPSPGYVYAPSPDYSGLHGQR